MCKLSIHGGPRAKNRNISLLCTLLHYVSSCIPSLSCQDRQKVTLSPPRPSVSLSVGLPVSPEGGRRVRASQVDDLLLDEGRRAEGPSPLRDPSCCSWRRRQQPHPSASGLAVHPWGEASDAAAAAAAAAIVVFRVGKGGVGGLLDETNPCCCFRLLPLFVLFRSSNDRLTATIDRTLSARAGASLPPSDRFLLAPATLGRESIDPCRKDGV